MLFLLSLTKLSAQTIAVQSFEPGGDTWIPVTLSTAACTNGSDRWDFSTSLSSITPNHLTQFWGIQDLNGNCGGASETISLPNVDVSVCTSASFAFDYYIIGYDNTDDITYELFYDNVGQGAVSLTPGASPFNTGGWSTVTVAIPGTVTNVSVIITVTQNGGSDYAGIDNINITGTGCPGCSPLTEPVNQITGQTTSNITCSSADLSWTNSIDGTHALVVMSTSPITGSPTDATAYAANSVFGSGATLNAGEFVVFNGTTGAVSVTGLSPSTTYFVEIFAYNGPTANCNENYLTGGTTFNFTTAGPVTEPTNESTGLASSNLDCFSATVNWTNGIGSNNAIVVISTSAITGTPTDGTAYTANANYGSGDIINAGEFVVYNGNGSSVNITGLSEGVTYFITVFEYNGTLSNCEENYLTGGNSISFTTTTGCTASNPQITSILYNSCSGSEAINEFFTFTTGTSAVEVDSININYPSLGVPDYCNVGCGANTNVNNPTYVNDLNTMAGCAIFTYADPIPPNATVMVFAGNPPSSVLDFSSQCGAAGLPIYVIFNNNTNGAASGRFSNSNGSPQTLSIYTGNGQSDTVSYIPTSQPVADGASVNFDAAGNPLYFNNASCIYPLPIELLDFNAQVIKDYTLISWSTASEINSDYFVLEKSFDGINYYSIATINGSGNSNHQTNYSFIDKERINNITYYRLKQIDFDGKFKHSHPIKIVDLKASIFYSEMGINFDLPAKNSQYYTANIYNSKGQLIKTTFVNSQHIIEWKRKGFYIVEIPELQIRQKIICN